MAVCALPAAMHAAPPLPPQEYLFEESIAGSMQWAISYNAAERFWLQTSAGNISLPQWPKTSGSETVAPGKAISLICLRDKRKLDACLTIKSVKDEWPATK